MKKIKKKRKWKINRRTLRLFEKACGLLSVCALLAFFGFGTYFSITQDATATGQKHTLAQVLTTH